MTIQSGGCVRCHDDYVCFEHSRPTFEFTIKFAVPAGLFQPQYSANQIAGDMLADLLKRYDHPFLTGEVLSAEVITPAHTGRGGTNG